MKLLFLLIVLHCGSSPAEAASPFRFFNPYSWFASAVNRSPVQTSAAAAANQSEEIGSSTAQADSMSTTENGNSSASPSPTLPPLDFLSPHPAPLSSLVYTPLRVQTVDIRDGDATTSKVLVPTHFAPLAAETPNIRRFGLIKDVAAEREETEPLTTAAFEISGASEASDKTETTTTRTPFSPSPASTISSTETETSAFTLPSSTVTATELTSLAVSQKQDILVATNWTSTTVAAAAATTSKLTNDPAETVTSPSPVYVGGSHSKHELTFLYDDEFVRYLNRHYYSSPVFGHIVGRGAH